MERYGLIFQECHYELADIKFVLVGLAVVTVETPLRPPGTAFRGFEIIISAAASACARLFNECRPRRGRRLNSDE